MYVLQDSTCILAPSFVTQQLPLWVEPRDPLDAFLLGKQEVSGKQRTCEMKHAGRAYLKVIHS